MTDHINTYPDLVNVEDWLNAKGYTGEAGACHNAMDKIRGQAARIASLEAALKPFADKAKVFHDYVDDYPIMFGAEPPLRVGDLRAARAAYLGEKE